MKVKVPFRRYCLCVLLGGGIGISGCLVPVFEHTGVKPSAIKPDRTTKETILKKFFGPDARTFDGRFFFYAYSRDSQVWVVPEPFKLFGSYSTGRILIEFDENNIVKRYVAHKCEKDAVDHFCGESESSLWAMVKELYGEDHTAQYRRITMLAESLAEPLEKAVKRSDLEEIKQLIDQGANVNAGLRGSDLPLHVATGLGLNDTVRLLIAEGANVSAINRYGHTPLHTAASAGHTGLAELFLANGGNVNAQDSSGTSPLLAAVRYRHTSIAKSLIGAGANVNLPNDRGETALHKAVHIGDMALVEILLENKAKVDTQTKTGVTPLYTAVAESHLAITRLLLDKGAKVNVTPDNLNTPLHLAAGRGDTELAELLIANGARVNASGWAIGGERPLHWAVADGHTAVVELLIAKGANVNAGGGVVGKPLHRAISKGHTNIIELLLANGADVNGKIRVTDNTSYSGYRNITAIELAARMGRQDIVELLTQHGAKE